MSKNIFKTLREIRKRSFARGFEFMSTPPATYYKNLKNMAGDVLSDEHIKECEELGILVDRDDQGTLLQIFTNLENWIESNLSSLNRKPKVR
ncbi:4-hydroxyphenylpyruvate dioxygenase [Corchorus olitorius]|uniref:4-hydroxyphenylpyruvate dioxygenase n=1 Tax=Corchorus olitorius TaxID=93759 RepID=A0A1R3IXA1_9ROSI|nr:4-hydroxyphenylpyruvate dioxygenase [Corchorus olitorius]